MQENRSFDHYFGVMRGVRGFGDPHPVTLPSGKPVWYQADGSTVVPPFRPDVGNLALTFIEDLDHSWDGTHEMFNGGNWDQWLPAKTTTCMAHMERSRPAVPLLRWPTPSPCATANHCSMLGPTDPNRYYMWTGWDGNDGQGGGPVIANDELGYGWQTYPERLQDSRDQLEDLPGHRRRPRRRRRLGLHIRPYIGNYGDTSLLYFFNYQNATAGQPALRAGAHRNRCQPERRLLRHPRRRRHERQAAERVVDRRPGGVHRASGVAGRLRRLVHRRRAQRADQRPRGVVEDGAADHLRRERRLLRPRRRAVPQRRRSRPGSRPCRWTTSCSKDRPGLPAARTGVVGPYGLGVRVPLLVVSPWSTGGWVCSEMFDHTSLIRFIEARFGVGEPNITPWRRAVSGDLTSAFDFESATDHVPALPSVAAYKPSRTTPSSADATTRCRRRSDRSRRRSRGVRPSRRLGYRFRRRLRRGLPTTLNLAVRNDGKLGVGLQARSLTVAGAPYTYTIGAGHELGDGAAQPGHLRPEPPRSERLLPPLRRVTGDGDARRGVADHGAGSLTLRIARAGDRHGRRHESIVVHVADAYGRDRSIELHGTTRDHDRHPPLRRLVRHRAHDTERRQLQLSARGSPGVRPRLTSDPQLGPQKRI